MPTFLTGLTAKLVGLGLVVLLIAGLWVRGEHYHNQRDKERAAHAETIRRVKVAQIEAEREAKAAHAAQEARYAALAEKGTANAQQTRQAAGDATARYIAAAPKCVRVEKPSGSRSPASPPTDRRSAELLAGVPQNSELAISEPDVRACGEATAYALSAREWALSLAP